VQGVSAGSTIYATPRRASDATSLMRVSNSRLPTYSSQPAPGSTTPPSGFTPGSRLPSAPGNGSSSARGYAARGSGGGAVSPGRSRVNSVSPGRGARVSSVSPRLPGEHVATAAAEAAAAAAAKEASDARAQLEAEKAQRTQLQELLARLEEEQEALRQQMQETQAQSIAAVQEARTQVEDLQRQLDDERCGNLATSTTSELMRTVRCVVVFGLGAWCCWARVCVCVSRNCSLCKHLLIVNFALPTCHPPLLGLVPQHD